MIQNIVTMFLYNSLTFVFELFIGNNFAYLNFKYFGGFFKLSSFFFIVFVCYFCIDGVSALNIGFRMINWNQIIFEKSFSNLLFNFNHYLFILITQIFDRLLFFHVWIFPHYIQKENKNSKIMFQNPNQDSTYQDVQKKTIFSFLTLLIICNFGYFNEIHLLKTIQKSKEYRIKPFMYRDCSVLVSGFVCESEKIDQGRSFVDENILISDCFFARSLTYNGDGGVIYVSGGSLSMNVNFSMFYSCACSHYGGAIYFESNTVSLIMICANGCFSTSSWYHFAFLVAYPINNIEYLSISKCSHSTSGYMSIFLQSGKQRVDKTNSSMNNAELYSGIRIMYPISCTSSHCTFSNNIVSRSMCINLHSNSVTVSMSYVNIVHNNSPNGNGVIYLNGAGLRKMMYCVFQNNSNYLFIVVDSCSLEVSHSFIDHSSSLFSTYSSISTETNNSFTNRMTYQIQYYNSHHCFADLTIPHRTPEQSPMISLKETIMRTIDPTIIETPMYTFEVTLINTQKETHINTLEETSMKTYEETLINTQKETHINTLEETSMKTFEETLKYTQKETLINTQKETHINTLEETSMKTFEETLKYTLKETHIITLEETIKETPKKTIPRSYAEIICSHQIADKREISVIFSFLCPIVILMIE